MTTCHPSKYLDVATAVGRLERLDAGESAVIARSLEYVEKTVLEVVYAELRALRFVPLIGGVDPGAKLYTWPLMDFVGEAKRTSDRGRSLPRVDAKTTEQSSAIEGYGAAYGYTTQELREVALAAKRGFNLPLDTIRARKCAEIIARKMDSVVAFGDADDARITGFLNNASVTIDSAAGAWASLTAAQLIVELFALANAPLSASKETLAADAIILPTDQWLLVTSTPLGANADRSVLEYFVESMRAAGRKMDVASWPLLSTANAGRSGARAVAYKRDVDVAGALVPLAFQAQPPQAKGLEWEIPCEGICGGAVVKQPLGIRYRDGL